MRKKVADSVNIRRGVQELNLRESGDLQETMKIEEDFQLWLELLQNLAFLVKFLFCYTVDVHSLSQENSYEFPRVSIPFSLTDI